MMPRYLLQTISRIVVLPPDSPSIGVLAQVAAQASGDAVMTFDSLFRSDPYLSTLFDDVLRVRILRANPTATTDQRVPSKP